MSTITIRNLPPDVIERMKAQAKRHGKSVEEEAVEVLRERFGDQSETEIEAERKRRRIEILDSLDEFHVGIANPVSAEQVQQWIAEGRKGRDWMKDSPLGRDE